MHELLNPRFHMTEEKVDISSRVGMITEEYPLCCKKKILRQIINEWNVRGTTNRGRPLFQ